MEERLHHPNSISQKNFHKKATTSIMKKNFHKQKILQKAKYSKSKKHSISKKTSTSKKTSKAEERYPLKLSTSRYLFFYRRNDLFLWEGLVSKNVNTSYI